MSVHLTEEEQLEVLKRWWKDYGNYVLAGVLVFVAGYFAYTTWQDKNQVKKETASAQYDTLLKLVAVQPGKTLSDSDRATAEHLASDLKAQNGNSLYAYGAAFFLSKLALDSNNLDKAASELQWILAAKPDQATAQLAHLRLARVLLAKGSLPEAQAQLTEEPSKAFAAEYSEVRGDILKAQGNKEAALTAYEKALKETDPQQQERTMILQMKVDELKSPAAAAAAQEKAQ